MIKVSDTRYNNAFRASQDLKSLLACVGERISVEIDFYYEDVTYARIDSAIILKPDNNIVNLYDTTGVIYAKDNTTFESTYVGDKIGVYDVSLNTYSYYTVLEKFNSYTIRTDYAGVQRALQPDTEYVFNCTPFYGLKYAYNLIESGNSFNSIIDGEYQQAVINTLDCTNTTDVLMTFTGIKSYQIGSLYVKGAGAFGGGSTLGTSIQQKFTITHNTVVTPLFLPNEYSDLLLSNKPEYFKDEKCLNYIKKLSIARYLNDPNGFQDDIDTTTKSNIGWHNENLNGLPTNYVLSSLTMTKGVTSVSQLKYGTDIVVEATITNTTDSPFSNGNTKYTFGFNYLPSATAQIANNGDNQTTNYLFDDKTHTVGSGRVNGNNYGTDLQVIKSVTSTYVSATQIKVTATINIASGAEEIMEGDIYNRYKMFVIIENHAATAINTDKVNLLLTVNNVNKTAYDSNIINVVGDETNFIIHPFTSKTDALDGADMDIFPVDDIVANTDFYIDYHAEVAAIEGVNAEFYIPLTSLNTAADMEIIIDSQTVATSSWQGSAALTAQKLVDSLNTGTAFISPFQGVSQPSIWAFNGATGYYSIIGTPSGAASVNGTSILIFAPQSGTSYNSASVLFAIKSSSTAVVYISKNGVNEVEYEKATEGVKIKKVQSKLLIRDTSSGQVDITLEDFTINTYSYPIIGNKAQAISYTQDKPYNIEAGIRKTISLARDTASDTGTDLYYNLKFPFLHRWEYWIQLATGSNPIPSDLYDTSKPFNGINNFWHRMAGIAAFYYQLTFTIEQDGNEFTQTFETEIDTSHDYNSNADWGTNSIKTYDGATELLNGSTKLILGYKDTTVKATFTKVSGSLPSLADVGIVIWIETYELGGVGGANRISSYYSVNSGSWFKSSDTSNKVVVTKSGSDYIGECKIDYTKLPTNKNYTIYARLYDFYELGLRDFEDGDGYVFADGTDYEWADSTGILTKGIGNAIKQNVSLIKTSATAGVRSSSMESFKASLFVTDECCYKMNVLAEALPTSDFFNDKYTFKSFWGEIFTSVTMKLQKYTNGAWADVATLNDATYGTYYPMGTYLGIYNDNFVGYQLDFQMILVGTGGGEGLYRVKATGVPLLGSNVIKYSFEFNLLTYTAARADETVRIEWWNNGNIGSIEDDTIRNDYGTLNLYNQIRLIDSFFGYDESDNIVMSSTKWQSGKEVWTEKSKIKRYMLDIGAVNNDIHRVLELDAFFPQDVRITDYNSQNPTNHENRYVIFDSDYKPKWNYGKERASVVIKFKQANQNHNLKRC
jgi:hypothetical protein